MPLAATTIGLVAIEATASIGGETLVEQRDEYGVEAEFTISPGQSGFVDQAGGRIPL